MYFCIKDGKIVVLVVQNEKLCIYNYLSTILSGPNSGPGEKLVVHVVRAFYCSMISILYNGP